MSITIKVPRVKKRNPFAALPVRRHTRHEDRRSKREKNPKKSWISEGKDF